MTAHERIVAAKTARDPSPSSAKSKVSKISKKSKVRKSVSGLRTSRSNISNLRKEIPKSKSQLGLRRNSQAYAADIISDNASHHSHTSRCFRRGCCVEKQRILKQI